MKSILSTFKSLLLALLLTTVSTAGHTTVVLPLSLEKMSQTAELIFEGHVTGTEVRFDERSQRVATFTTFSVSDVIKGNVGNEHTIKQIGGRLPGSDVELRIHGVPKFEVGQYYVIFLPAESRLGFTSPIGLSQGKFTITQINQQSVVSNGRTVDGLNDRSTRERLGTQIIVSEQQHKAATTSGIELKAIAGKPTYSTLQDFKATVRNMVVQ